MYLCICHGLNEGAVDHACTSGACSAARVFRHYDVKPQCGKCVRAIQDVVKSRQSARGADPAPLAASGICPRKAARLAREAAQPCPAEAAAIEASPCLPDGVLARPGLEMAGQAS